MALSTGKWDSMVRVDSSIKKALQLDPRHKGALEYQGELFIKTNKKELAEKNLILLKNICGTSCSEYKKLEKALKKAY